MDNSNVLHLHRAPPLRATIARLAQNYPAQLAFVMRDARLADGTKDDNGALLCRGMTPREQRAAALNTAGQLFASFFWHRIKMEQAAGVPAVGLYDFFEGCAVRLNSALTASLGEGSATVTDSEAAAPLHAFHSNIVQAVFGAFRLEMTQEKPDEPAFWRRVFLGFSDVDDPSHVVTEAARMIFLDHQPTFETALQADMAHAATHAVGVTRN